MRDALAREAKDSTKLIVAQRIGTIMNADRIVVLDDGKVVGQGTHEELLDNVRSVSPDRRIAVERRRTEALKGETCQEEWDAAVGPWKSRRTSAE